VDDELCLHLQVLPWQGTPEVHSGNKNKTGDKAKMRNGEEMGPGEYSKNITLNWCFPNES